MQIASTLKTLWRRYHPASPTGDVTLQPLLNKQRLKSLHAAATSLQTPSLVIQKEVRFLLLGESASSHTGSGYEFADNRPYIHGEDTRHLNWQLLARSGQLYRKVFHEEHRSQVWLVMDRRSQMRFATRNKLKVSLAAELAIYHLYQAQSFNIEVGGLFFDHNIEQVRPSQELQSLQKQVISPCPPLENDSSNISLQKILNLLQVQLSPGCIVILLSDFHDLDASMTSALHQLASQHHLLAYHIIDPAEQSLPRQGQYFLSRGESHENLEVNSSNSHLFQVYHEVMQQRHRYIEKTLQSNGMIYQQLFTDQDIPFLDKDNIHD